MKGENATEALMSHLSRADLDATDLAPTTLELALEWDGRARKVRELVESRIAPARGPATIFIPCSRGI